jgi:hypothetical protein
VVITYTRDIPDAPNNPSVDQGPMKTNTNSIDTIIAVDHYTFADVPSGTHKQVTISGKNAGGAQTDPASIMYTSSGTASSVANLNYRNQNGIFPLNCVRAWALVTGAGTIDTSQSVNVVGPLGHPSTGNYQVTLTANAVSSNKFAVIVSGICVNPGNAVIAGYNITGVGTFDLNFFSITGGTFANPTGFSFMVLQI